MVRPIPTRLFHFTRAEHIPTIIEHGLLSDSLAQVSGLMQIEIGQKSIKAQRARASVRIAPGGFVSEYVPFYFAPRSSMMHNIHSGLVPSYTEGCERLVYLATTTQRLITDGMVWVGTNRNAALNYAEFTSDDEELGELVNWPVMDIERCTPHEDRIERRMAEFLVHDCVPFGSIMKLAVKSEEMRVEVAGMVAEGGSSIEVLVRPDWYF